jgi:uncharacterized protein YbcI
MDTAQEDISRQIADLASAFQERWTGHKPQSVSVVLNGDTLVITLHEALSPAEKALSQTTAGAAQVQEFHSQLFASSSGALCQEIKRITGLEVREAAAEVEPPSGTVIHAFATGTVVQIFHLAKRPPAKVSGGSHPSISSEVGNSAGSKSHY